MELQTMDFNLYGKVDLIGLNPSILSEVYTQEPRRINLPHAN